MRHRSEVLRLEFLPTIERKCGFVEKSELNPTTIFPTSPHLQQHRQRNHQNQQINRYICERSPRQGGLQKIKSNEVITTKL